MSPVLSTITPQIGVLFFLLITFGISVIEKLADWKGTIAYIEANFKQTFIKNLITPLITGLLILEVITCILIVYGVYSLIFYNDTFIAFLGLIFSGICVLYMLIGQRIAKDYVGATSLTVYFILIIIGMYLLNN